MIEHPPTLLNVLLHPEHYEETCSYVGETLTTAGITYRLIAEFEERASLESATPFVFMYIEKHLVFALLRPIVPKVIDDMGILVTTGLILGFTVKGEIALDDEMGVINNLVV
jgi:hypothetical protein